MRLNLISPAKYIYNMHGEKTEDLLNGKNCTICYYKITNSSSGSMYEMKRKCVNAKYEKRQLYWGAVYPMISIVN